MRKAFIFTATLLAASLAHAVSGTGAASFTLLPYAPMDVSANGKVAVGDYLSSANDNLWMWNATSGATSIGGKSSINTGAGNVLTNADGSLIYGTAIDANGVRNTSVYNVATGVWTSMGGLGGYSATAGASSNPATNAAGFVNTGSVWGASSNGNFIVGQSYAANGSNNSRATIWNTQTGAIINLGANPLSSSGPNQRTRAQGISDDGKVVGGFGFNSSPLVWTDFDGDGTYSVVNVSAAGGSIVNQINDVSANGVWAVGAGYVGTGAGSAYRFNTGTNSLQLLGMLSTGTRDVATAVNATGSVIVGYEDVSSANPALRTGFIWTESLGMQSLNSYLASVGVDTSSFNFTTPTAISADGLSIVGVGYATGGTAAQGFLVNLPAAAVPEPAEYAMLAWGLMMLVGVVRRRRKALSA